MSASLQNKAINSMIWCTVDKFGMLSLSFVSNLILARLLMPEAFGCIAILHVFLAVADIIVHGGFASAIIQKKDPTHLDYTSAFFCNLAISVTLYTILFHCAPLIANFYQLPVLCIVLRVQSIELIINSFSVVQLGIIKRNLQFKTLAFRDLIGSFIGLTAGVVCAIYGLDVWSLVVNVLASRIAGVILLWMASDWRPTFEFSIQSVKSLFGFGGILMVTSILSTIYDNLQSLIIGKFFSTTETGYVNQAKKLESVPAGALSSVVTQVSFPVFSKLQDEKNRLKYGLRKNIKSIQYVNLPMMVLLIIIAKPLMLLCYGEKWLMCVPYFQILCVGQLISVVNPIHCSVVMAVGNAKTHLLAQIIKFVVAIILISISVKRGVDALLWTLTIIPYIEFLVYSLINKKIVDYGVCAQLYDMLPTALVTALLAIVIKYIGKTIPLHPYSVMLVQSLIFVGLYIGITYIFKFDGFKVYSDVIAGKLKKNIK